MIFEERDRELVKLMDELVDGKRKPTTEDYYRIGSAKVDRSTYAGKKMRGELDMYDRPVYYANDEDLNFERSVVGLYLTKNCMVHIQR